MPAPDATTAAQLLATDPRSFLQKYPLRVWGSEQASQILIATLQQRANAARRPMPVVGTFHMLETRAYEIRTPALPGQAVAGANASHAFPAHYVHMHSGALPPPLYRLPLGQPAIMITPLLTGCSFVIVPQANGEVDVAHVRPVGIAGAQLPAQLSADLPDGAIVYGATPDNYTSGTRVVTIIGVLRNGVWRIYAQKQEDLGAQGEFRIMSVHRIYPAED